MAKKLPEPKLGDMVPVDIRITNVNEIPAKYFLHDEILQALHRIIRTEVVVRGEPVPPGAEAIFSHYTMAAAHKRFVAANDELKHQLRRLLPGLVFLMLVVAGATIVAWCVWRWLNG